MSKFDLRDVSKRLSESRDTEAVVFEFLGYLQSLRQDWHASLAFYEVSRDALVSLYTREGDRLATRDILLPVEQLPTRLVRKFFHPNAFSNAPTRRSLLSSLFKSSPYYEPEGAEASSLRLVAPISDWISCVCMPLADQEDLLAMLVLASRQKGAFSGRVLEELLPVKGMAALALAQHLYRSARTRPAEAPADDAAAIADAPAPAPAPGQVAGAEFQEQIRRFEAQPPAAAGDTVDHRLEALTQELALADRSSSDYRQELERVKEHLHALEEQSNAATEHLSAACTQLTETQDRMAELQRSAGFLQDVFQMMSQEHDPLEFTGTMVMWFSEAFGIERCSLMVMDANRETMSIAAQRGLDPAMADRVRVRVGQGISGWVAQNRKPLFVRVKTDAREVAHTGQDVYNSDSFITVPLIHGDRVVGVLNLSNKAAGLPFDQLDLDRATLTASLLAMTLGAAEIEQKSGAWA